MARGPPPPPEAASRECQSLFAAVCTRKPAYHQRTYRASSPLWANWQQDNSARQMLSTTCPVGPRRTIEACRSTVEPLPRNVVHLPESSSSSMPPSYCCGATSARSDACVRKTGGDPSVDGRRAHGHRTVSFNGAPVLFLVAFVAAVLRAAAPSISASCAFLRNEVIATACRPSAQATRR